MFDFLTSAVFIFTLRLIDVSIDTIRVFMVVRGKMFPAWVAAFIKAFIFIIAIQAVLTDLGNVSKIIGYAAGFATGVVVGMWIEEKLAFGYTHLRIISTGRGDEIVEVLRNQGHAVTEVSANGMSGMVALLHCFVLRRNAHKVQKLIEETDPDTFITSQNMRAVQRGFWRKA